MLVQHLICRLSRGINLCLTIYCRHYFYPVVIYTFVKLIATELVKDAHLYFPGLYVIFKRKKHVLRKKFYLMNAFKHCPNGNKINFIK